MIRLAGIDRMLTTVNTITREEEENTIPDSAPEISISFRKTGESCNFVGHKVYACYMESQNVEYKES